MLTVTDIMSTEVFAVAESTGLDTAARLLTSLRVTGAPVVDDRGSPVGVVSLADLANPDTGANADRPGTPLYYYFSGGERIVCGDDVETRTGTVRDVMSYRVLSVPGVTSVHSATALILRENVHRLLVLEGGRLVGIVTMTDLLRAFVSEPATPSKSVDPTEQA